LRQYEQTKAHKRICSVNHFHFLLQRPTMECIGRTFLPTKTASFVHFAFMFRVYCAKKRCVDNRCNEHRCVKSDLIVMRIQNVLEAHPAGISADCKCTSHLLRVDRWKHRCYVGHVLPHEPVLPLPGAGHVPSDVSIQVQLSP
jgi:hypothetical protein